MTRPSDHRPDHRPRRDGLALLALTALVVAGAAATGCTNVEAQRRRAFGLRLAILDGDARAEPATVRLIASDATVSEVRAYAVDSLAIAGSDRTGELLGLIATDGGDVGERAGAAAAAVAERPPATGAAPPIWLAEARERYLVERVAVCLALEPDEDARLDRRRMLQELQQFGHPLLPLAVAELQRGADPLDDVDDADPGAWVAIESLTFWAEKTGRRSDAAFAALSLASDRRWFLWNSVNSVLPLWERAFGDELDDVLRERFAAAVADPSAQRDPAGTLPLGQVEGWGAAVLLAQRGHADGLGALTAAISSAPSGWSTSSHEVFRRQLVSSVSGWLGAAPLRGHLDGWITDEDVSIRASAARLLAALAIDGDADARARLTGALEGEDEDAVLVAGISALAPALGHGREPLADRVALAETLGRLSEGVSKGRRDETLQAIHGAAHSPELFPPLRPVAIEASDLWFHGWTRRWATAILARDLEAHPDATSVRAALVDRVDDGLLATRHDALRALLRTARGPSPSAENVELAWDALETAIYDDHGLAAIALEVINPSVDAIDRAPYDPATLAALAALVIDTAPHPYPWTLEPGRAAPSVVDALAQGTTGGQLDALLVIGEPGRAETVARRLKLEERRPGDVDLYGARLDHEAKAVRTWAAERVFGSGWPETTRSARAELARDTLDPDDDIGWHAAAALSRIGDADDVVDLVDDGYGDHAATLVRTLRDAGGDDAVVETVLDLAASWWEDRSRFGVERVFALALEGDAVRAALRDWALDAPANDRTRALRLLAERDDAEIGRIARIALAEAESERTGVLAAAADALVQTGGVTELQLLLARGADPELRPDGVAVLEDRAARLARRLRETLSPAEHRAALAELLGDGDERARGIAVREAAVLPEAERVAMLANWLAEADPDDEVREVALDAIAAASPPTAGDGTKLTPAASALVALLDASDGDVAGGALARLRDRHPVVLAARAETLLGHGQAAVRVAVVEALADRAVAPGGRPSSPEAREAARRRGEEARAARAAIGRASTDEAASVRRRAIEVLGRFADPAAAQLVLAAVRDEDADVRRTALRDLAARLRGGQAVGRPEAVTDAAAELLGRGDGEVEACRLEAVAVLAARLGARDGKARSALEAARGDGSFAVRAAARTALERTPVRGGGQ